MKFVTKILFFLGWIIGITFLLWAQLHIAQHPVPHKLTSFILHHGSSPSVPGYVLLATGSLIIATLFILQRKQSDIEYQFPLQLSVFAGILLVLLAIPIRLYHLGTVPYGAYNDEIVKGMQVIKFFQGGEFQPFYIANKEFLFFYFLIPFVKFFGITITGLRSLPFTCGLLTVLFTYLLFRRLINLPVAVCAAGLLAIGLWPGQSSHICERLNSAPLFTATGLYLTLVAIQTRKSAFYFLTGLVLAGGMWTFPTFRLIPWAAFGLMIYSLASHKSTVTSSIFRLSIALVTFLATVTAPLKFNFMETFHIFYSRRGHDFKIAKNGLQIREFAVDLLQSVNVDCVQDMSFTLTDSPLLWWPLGAFFIVGVLHTISRFKKFESVFLFVWTMAACLPAIASEPAVRRLTAAQPLIFGITGIGLWLSICGVLPFLHRKNAWGLIPAAAFICMAGWNNYGVFTETIAPKWKIASEDYWMVESALENLDRFEVHMDWIEEEAELPYRYLSYPITHDLDWYKPEKPRFSIPFRFDPARDFIYYFRNIPENKNMVELLTELYPEGVLVLHQNHEHPRGYYSFTMRKDDLEQRRGFIINDSENDLLKENLTTLKGILLTDKPGVYQFRLSGLSEPNLEINSQRIEPEHVFGQSAWYRCFLLSGAQNVTVTARESIDKAQIRIEWQTPPDHQYSKKVVHDRWFDIPKYCWLKPPFPSQMQSPFKTQKSTYQFKIEKTKYYPHSNGNPNYDIARIEQLSDGTYLANCWHYRLMVRLDENAEIIGQWNANLVMDPDWMLRFDFDISPDQTVFIIGDTHKKILATSIDGELLRTINIPCDPLAIQVLDNEQACLLSHNQVYTISLKDGSIISKHGQWGDGNKSYRWPIAIVTDTNHNCYVADRSFNRVQVYDRTGQWLKSIAIPGPLDDSFGMTIDPNGNLLIPHFTLNRVFTISPNGHLVIGSLEYAGDSLDSTRVRHPRYILFTGNDAVWMTNGDTIYFARLLPDIDLDLSLD